MRNHYPLQHILGAVKLRVVKCGCRVGGFSFDRLESKGLYAQIFPIEGKVDMGDFVADRMRHMHPSEVALANGVQPQLVGTPGFLRLELSRCRPMCITPSIAMGVQQPSS